MHKLQDKRVPIRFDRGEVLARLDHYFGDADLAGFTQRFAQKGVSFGSALLRLQVVRLVKEHRVDLVEFNKIHDIDRLGGLEVDAAEILFFEHDKFALLIFVAFNDVFPRDFLAIGFRDTFVVDRAEILRPSIRKLNCSRRVAV